MSWLWMALFLILSAVAVGLPFLRRSAGEPREEPPEDPRAYLRHRIEASLQELDLDLAAGKLTPEDHAAAAAELRARLENPAP